MKTPHKHAELIKAWADGAEIQEKYSFNDWRVFDGYWQEDEAYGYRIKPEPKPDVVYYGVFDIGDVRSGTRIIDSCFTSMADAGDDIKLTFDGSTGKLKSAEVL